MQTALQLKRKLDYARFVHLAVVFMMAMFLFLFSTIPEKKWVLLTVLVVSAGIEPGLIIRRSIHRMGGTLAALLILVPLIYLIQLNYRFIPVLFILTLIALNVTALNTRRYDISVFFVTLSVFLLLAQTTDANSPQGPVEMMINRGTCTLIGIIIVLVGDYVLFQSYRYSHKLYFFHQMVIYNFFKEKIQEIDLCKQRGKSTFLFLERMRDQIIAHFAPIAISSENLKLEHKVSEHTKEQIVRFQSAIWEIRRLLFALSMSELVLEAPDKTERHLQRFDYLMAKAKENFIY
ncbi:FUSC family protein [Legionella sp. km772]|uniref:FUSC family protein n=1 Tax=Legionella sp. km772 TaxID=2498111 RepID=UPI000F8E27CF|nr:FUSC family protein [Legionella sp. km772]RUR09720.1 FUSC family protein [Legionella sp. km772]